MFFLHQFPNFNFKTWSWTTTISKAGAQARSIPRCQPEVRQHRGWFLRQRCGKDVGLIHITPHLSQGFWCSQQDFSTSLIFILTERGKCPIVCQQPFKQFQQVTWEPFFKSLVDFVSNGIGVQISLPCASLIDCSHCEIGTAICVIFKCVQIIAISRPAALALPRLLGYMESKPFVNFVSTPSTFRILHVDPVPCQNVCEFHEFMKFTKF